MSDEPRPEGQDSENPASESATESTTAVEAPPEGAGKLRQEVQITDAYQQNLYQQEINFLLTTLDSSRLMAGFTGWVGPVEDSWVLAVAARPAGTVAAGRRGLLDVGALVAEELGTTAVDLRVLHDRQLVMTT